MLSRRRTQRKYCHEYFNTSPLHYALQLNVPQMAQILALCQNSELPNFNISISCSIIPVLKQLNVVGQIMTSEDIKTIVDENWQLTDRSKKAASKVRALLPECLDQGRTCKTLKDLCVSAVHRSLIEPARRSVAIYRTIHKTLEPHDFITSRPLFVYAAPPNGRVA